MNENNKDCEEDDDNDFALDHLSGLKFNLDKEGKRLSSPAVKMPMLLTKMAKASTGPTRLSKTPQSSNKRQYPASKKKKSTKRTKRDFIQKKPSVDESLSLLLQLKLAEARKPKDVVGETVLRAKQFREMSDALGSKIKAASHCPTFIQFLDVAEKQELEQYKKDNNPDGVNGVDLHASDMV